MLIAGRSLTESFRAFDFNPLLNEQSDFRRELYKKGLDCLNIEISINHPGRFVSNDDRWKIFEEREKLTATFTKPCNKYIFGVNFLNFCRNCQRLFLEVVINYNDGLLLLINRDY